MKIKFYGVRGSYPVPGKKNVEYGGNTTCVSISKEIDGLIYRVIIDSGTGIIQLGKDSINNFFQKKESLNIPILFTHLHPDHTQGFPFFAPNFFESNLFLYGMMALQKGLEEILSAQMVPPNFPIEYGYLVSNRNHYTVRNGRVHVPINDFPFLITSMQAYAPSHPQQGAVYYKIEDKETGKSVACIWDNESKVGGDKAVINFIHGCDMVIHDTQYTQEEYINGKRIVQGFGHSTYDMAIDNACQAEVAKLCCIHYNPDHTDEKLDSINRHLQDLGVDFEILMSKEQMEVEL